jgi:hypothetical protein
VQIFDIRQLESQPRLLLVPLGGDLKDRREFAGYHIRQRAKRLFELQASHAPHESP